MRRKYVFTGETKEVDGHTVRRIRAVRGLVLADGTEVHKGNPGGWVESPGNLAHTGRAWVGNDAVVMDDAEVWDDALVAGSAVVCGRAKVADRAVVRGYARVSCCATVCGDAAVRDRARVLGDATVAGAAFVGDDAAVLDNAIVAGVGTVVRDHAQVAGRAKVRGATVSGAAFVGGDAEVADGARVRGNAVVDGDALVYGDADIADGALVNGPDDWALMVVPGMRHRAVTGYITRKAALGKRGFRTWTGTRWVVDDFVGTARQLGRWMAESTGSRTVGTAARRMAEAADACMVRLSKRKQKGKRK